MAPHDASRSSLASSALADATPDAMVAAARTQIWGQLTAACQLRLADRRGVGVVVLQWCACSQSVHHGHMGGRVWRPPSPLEHRLTAARPRLSDRRGRRAVGVGVAVWRVGRHSRTWGKTHRQP